MGQQELLHLHIPLRHFLTFLIFTVCPSLLWGDGWLSGNLVECVVIEPHKRAHSPLRTVAIAINRAVARWRLAARRLQNLYNDAGQDVNPLSGV